MRTTTNILPSPIVNHDPKPNMSRSVQRGRKPRTHRNGAGVPTHPTVKCTHYNRSCNILAPCCGRLFCCPKGHDASMHCSKRLETNRTRITRLVCCHCKKEQPVRNSCQYCARSFSRHGCTSCLIWDNSDAFHCNRCGVCRRGRRSDNWHCDSCNVCFPLSARNHTCTIAATGPCALCGISMLRSTEVTRLMKCGHVIHESCFLKRVSKSFSCPRPECRKSVASIPLHVNAVISTPATKRDYIYCRDCRSQSYALCTHGYWQCLHCRSINTVRVAPGNKVPSASHR